MKTAIMILSMFLLLLVVFLFGYWFHIKQLRKKDDQINGLKESISGLQAKLAEMERRRGYRIQLPDQQCLFAFIGFGDPLLEPLTNRKGEGKIENISRTGVKLSCEFDLPVRKRIFVQLHFALHGEEFSFKGKIVRKEETMKEIMYGIDFIEVDPKEQQRLVQTMQKIEIEKKKMTE
ncbi:MULTISPECIES: PilZ domain-containing protein [Cohnella]|uniref:PilZ domain-containing protein n=1 Tax=Cohnella TaxID=329857 RepID=UPI00036FC518|nr:MULTISPECIES: PilZ domain-containing protein [Cohnella]